MRPPSQKRCSDRSGFSLAELLVALGLAGVVLTILVAFFNTIGRSSAAQNAAAAAQQEARLAIDYIVRELRLAGLDPLGSAAAGIEEIARSGNKLRFTADRCDQPIGGPGNCLNPVPDGDLDDMSERVTFYYDVAARTMRRCLYETEATHGTDVSDGTCQPLVEGVAPNPDGSPVFTFLDENSNTVTAPEACGEIRSVVITLTVEAPAGGAGTIARTYAARLRLRNIGL
jgi:prepilin-type N-terminal cleavage/methylation domain-containing protein